MKLFHSRHHDSPTLGGGVIVHPTDHPSAMLVIDAHASHSQRGSSDFRTADHSGEYRPAEFALDASRHHGELTHPARSPSPTSAVTDQKARARRSAQFGAGSSSSSGSSSSCPANDNDNNDDSRTSSPTNTSPTSKRALHLEHHESECPVANPDPHSRPRSRQFFRLGRNRYKGIDKASHGNKAAGPYAGCTSSDSSDGEDNTEAGMVRKNNRRSSTTVAGSNKAKLTLRKPRMRRSQSLPTDINSKSKVVVEGGSSSSSSDPAKAEFMSASERLSPNAALDSTDKLSLSVPAVCTHRRHVTFTSVSIREYSTILGDHPCCPSGPPLSLGWELERENSMEFETYERVREPIRVKTKEDMRLDGDVRRDILQSLVVTSPCASGDEAGGSSSDKEEDGDNIEKKQCCAMYSDRDLRLAERRCQRERSNNSRMNRRMNRGFFRTPLTAEESDGPVIAATEEEPGSPMNEDRTQAVGNNERCAAGEGSCSMDISPIKLRQDDDSDTMVESSP